MSNIQAIRERQRFEFNEQINKQWSNYYAKNNLQTQRSTQNSYLPSTPVIAAIGQLNSSIAQMEKNLFSRNQNETEEGRNQRIKSNVQRQYDKLIDEFNKLRSAGVLGKEHTLDSLLFAKPQLYAYIHSNIIPQKSTDIINMVEQSKDPELKALLPLLLEQYPSQLSAKKATKTLSIQPSASSAPSQQVSTNSDKVAVIQQLSNMAKGFLNHSGLSKLPDHLEAELQIILDSADKNLNSGTSAMKLIAMTENFYKHLQEELQELDEYQMGQRLETDAFIDSDDNEPLRIERRQKPSASPMDADDQPEDERYLVEHPDHYSDAYRAVSNNYASDIPSSPYESDKTNRLLREIQNNFNLIPLDYKSKNNSRKKLEKEWEKIEKAIIKTDMLAPQSLARRDAVDDANDFKKKLAAVNRLMNQTSSSASTSSAAVGSGKKKKKSLRTKKNDAVKRKTPMAKYIEPKVKIVNKKTVSLKHDVKQTPKAELKTTGKRKITRISPKRFKELVKAEAAKLNAPRKAFNKDKIMLSAKPKVSFSLKEENSNSLPRGIKVQ